MLHYHDEKPAQVNKTYTLCSGVVYKAIDLNTNKHVALKKIRVEIEDEGRTLHSTLLRERSSFTPRLLIRFVPIEPLDRLSIPFLMCCAV